MPSWCRRSMKYIFDCTVRPVHEDVDGDPVVVVVVVACVAVVDVVVGEASLELDSHIQHIVLRILVERHEHFYSIVL